MPKKARQNGVLQNNGSNSLKNLSTRSSGSGISHGPGPAGYMKQPTDVSFWSCGHLLAGLCSLAFSQAPTGLLRVSLQFSDPSLEQAYVLSRAAELQLEVVRFSLAEAALCGSASLVWVVLQNHAHGQSDAVMTLVRVRQVVLACLAVCGAMLVGLFQAAWFKRLTSPFFREVFTIILLIFHVPALISTDAYYMAKLLGHEDPWDVFRSDMSDADSYFSDARVLLCTVAAIIVSQLLPIRWCILVFVEFCSVVVYCGIVIVLGSPEGADYATANSTLLVSLAMLALLGKRRTEASDRLLFFDLVKERKLRFEKELELAIFQQRNPMRCDSTATADTAYLFTSELQARPRPGELSILGMEAAQERALERQLMKIADLGHKEHWLISATEVRLQPGNIIGAGGFGVVVAATYHGSTVAVKLPRSARWATKMQHLPPLVNELRVLRHLRHPHIVLFFGACINPGTGELMLVFEWVRGQSLDRFIGKPPDDPDTCSRYQILMEICCALRYLHAQDPLIVHGDLKASNVLIENWKEGPRAKLIDFGLSRLMSQRPTAPLGGSLHWVAPEVVQDPTMQPSPNADTFSFGRLAFFTVTGRMPLKQYSRHQIMQAARNGIVPPLQWPTPDSDEEGAEDVLFVPALLSECQSLCEQCLQANPRSRPEIAAVHAEISEWSLPNPQGLNRIHALTGRRLGAEWPAKDDVVAHVGAAEAVPHWQAAVSKVRDSLPPEPSARGHHAVLLSDDPANIIASEKLAPSLGGEVAAVLGAKMQTYLKSASLRSAKQEGIGPRWLGLLAKSKKPLHSLGLSSAGSTRPLGEASTETSEDNSDVNPCVPSERGMKGGPPPSQPEACADKLMFDRADKLVTDHVLSCNLAQVSEPKPPLVAPMNSLVTPNPSEGFFVYPVEGTEEWSAVDDRIEVTKTDAEDENRRYGRHSTLDSDSSFRWAVP